MRALALAALLAAAARASCREPPYTDPTTQRASGDEGDGGAAAGDASAGAEAAGDAGPRRPRPREIAARHVLVMYAGSQRAPARVSRTRDEARARADEVLRRARAGEDFAQLAATYSDEPGAAQRGGDLGTFGHGSMVPAFERAAFALEVDQISDIVETPFGFHVIQRTQ